ncbi:hypothetical protein FKM82_001095 [Ascaphus truei]
MGLASGGVPPSGIMDSDLYLLTGVESPGPFLPTGSHSLLSGNHLALSCHGDPTFCHLLSPASPSLLPGAADASLSSVLPLLLMQWWPSCTWRRHAEWGSLSFPAFRRGTCLPGGGGAPPSTHSTSVRSNPPVKERCPPYPRHTRSNQRDLYGNMAASPCAPCDDHKPVTPRLCVLWGSASRLLRCLVLPSHCAASAILFWSSSPRSRWSCNRVPSQSGRRFSHLIPGSPPDLPPLCWCSVRASPTRLGPPRIRPPAPWSKQTPVTKWPPQLFSAAQSLP